jgi:cell division protein FtsI/penicillin-binding protein 2
MGSLVKPFLALSWSGKYPAFECRGAAGSCWRPQPHGHLDFAEALAQSCNAYFLQLAAGVDERSLQSTAATFGIAAPKLSTPEARIGLGEAWKISAHALLKAYAELASHRGDPRVDPILTGLALSARRGTSKEIGAGALAKTGTAACPAPRRHAGDGLAIVLAPADAPRYAVLVRQHDVPGSRAAAAARRILQVLRP